MKLGQKAIFTDLPTAPHESVILANHFFVKVRSVIIIAKPNSFKNTILLLKESQGNIPRIQELRVFRVEIEPHESRSKYLHAG
jgi:hypothetical protein